MLIQWCSRSSDDPDSMMTQWWSRSSDDPDLMQMTWRWRWLDDEYDLKMKMNWIWRWLEDEYDLKMKMTWRWRWRELNDDPYYTEKKTCADKLCRENTLLVKRDYWCNCNFRMYSSVYLMYCTPMFILGSICNVIESFHAPMFQSGDSIM